jgi:hypothetical protein
VEEAAASRTVKVVFAISRGAWLLSLDWLLDCCKEGQPFRPPDADEQLYEVKYWPGARRSREARTHMGQQRQTTAFSPGLRLTAEL